MKRKQSFLLVMLSSLFLIKVFANPLRIEVRPSKPVFNETFSVRVILKTSSSEEPYVSFDPIGLEVLSRNTEVSVQTVFSQGKIKTLREITYSYDVISERPRTAYLKNIIVEQGGEEFKHKDIRIDVLREKRQSKTLFLQAEVSKTDVFKGEGVDVHYYLYRKIPVVGEEIKRFPKLNKFIKRFHHVTNKEDTVNYNGELYKKSLKYSARVYPEKVGKAFIDSLQMRVQFPKKSRNSQFGAFGFGLRQYGNKILQSPKVEIRVKPLPAEGAPASFTGIIGDHTIQLDFPKKRYLVNEVMELKLIIEGPGALENMEAPILLERDELEKFDTRGELEEIDNRKSRKIFDYTFLARDSFESKEEEIELAFFNPETEQYIVKKLLIPSISISGIARSGRSGQEATSITPPEKNELPLKERANKKKSVAYSPASMDHKWGHLSFRWINLVFYSLFIIIFIQVIEFSYTTYFKGSIGKDEVDKQLKQIKKTGLNYSNLFKLLNIAQSTKEEQNLDKIISNLPLPQSTQDYFFELISILEKRAFGDKKRDDEASTRPIFKTEHFDRLVKGIRDANKENVNIG
jgi:hypothetical protein